MGHHLRRRAILGAAAAGALVALADGSPAAAVEHDAAASGRRARRRSGPATFVFVTGANGSASAPPELARAGHRVLGVDLPGHRATDAQFSIGYQCPQDAEALATEPSPVAGVTLEDYAEAVRDAVVDVAGFGPVVLVGGSMGGTVITKVANRVPHLIDHLVYDAAFLCVDLPSAAEYLQTEEGSGHLGGNLVAGVVADPTVVGAVRINWRSADPEFLAAAREAMMADGSEAEFMNVLSGLQPDESLTASSEDARADRRTWGRIRRTYIRHTADRMIPIALQDRMIAEADQLTPSNPTEVRTVETGHAPSAEKYAEVVRILDRIGRRHAG